MISKAARASIESSFHKIVNDVRCSTAGLRRVAEEVERQIEEEEAFESDEVTPILGIHPVPRARKDR